VTVLAQRLDKRGLGFDPFVGALHTVLAQAPHRKLSVGFDILDQQQSDQHARGPATAFKPVKVTILRYGCSTRSHANTR
jgi:hypothetical protein